MALLLATSPDIATPQEAVYVIRHAEKAEGSDPEITDAGRARATRWAAMLADAGIEKVFTSTARRTRETGAIIAEALDVETEALEPSNIAGLLDLMAFDHEDGRVLVVGHTETIPSILRNLGAEKPVTLPADDFGLLFVVIPTSGAPRVLDLRMP